MTLLNSMPRRIALLALVFGLVGLASPPLHAQLCPATFVYVNNNTDNYGPNGPDTVGNSVSAFGVNCNTGALTPVSGSPFATGGYGSGYGYYAANGIAATVVGNFVYASDSVSNDIAAFSINPDSGALTLIGTYAYGTAEDESNPDGISLAITPNGQFLYASNSDTGDIWGFSIGESGALTSLPTGQEPPGPLYTFPADTFPDGISVTRDGNYLAVAMGNTGLEVAMFSIIQPGGTLAPVAGSPFSTPGTAGSASATASVEINCASNELFAPLASAGAADISVETINSGALNPITPSNFTFPTSTSTYYDSNVAVLNPNDNLLFVSNQFSNTIMSLNVASGGALSAVTGSPFCNSSNAEDCVPSGEVPAMTPLLMGTNQAGTLLFVANSNVTNPGTEEQAESDNTVTDFTIGANGALTLVSVSPAGFDTGAPGQPSLVVFPPKVCGLSVGKTFNTPTNTPTVTYPSPIGFTVTMSNGVSAPIAATGVSMNDPLPGGVGASWSIMSYSEGLSCGITGATGSQVLNCSIGDLPADTSASVQVSSTAPAAQTYVNTAEVTSSGGSPIYSSATVTVNANAETLETLQVSLSGTGTGYVGYVDYDCVDTAGTITGNCSENFSEGALVTLTASAAEGSTFAGWGGACAYAGTNPSCTVTMAGMVIVTATFNPVIYYTLTVAPQGLGAGTVQDPTGEIFDCVFAYASTPSVSGTCSQSYASGTEVTLTLTATPTSPSIAFGGWGGLCAGFGTTTTCTLSFTITSSQVITASFPLPPSATTVQFSPGSNVSQMIQNCPDGVYANGLCTDANASAFTVTIPTVSSAFSLTVVATELDPNGLCPASQVSLGGQSSDFSCRFVSFFNYGTDPAGDVIVPLCYPYLNGDCVHYYLYSGTPGNEPPPGSFSGGLFLKIGWNNVFAPPLGSYWYSSTPAPVMLDDPAVNEFPPLPYGDICSTPMLFDNGETYLNSQGQQIYCQFDQNITTFFTPGPGLDPIGGTIPAANDVVVAFLPTSTGTNPAVQPPTPTAPTITASCISGCAISGGTITFNQGTAGTLVVSTTGYPAPSLSLSEPDGLPAGLTFNGTTGTISGTPAAGTGGTSYPISFTATNGVAPNATANFTLTVSSLQVSPPVLNFGTLYLGQISTAAVTLTNTGNTPITVSKAMVTTPGNAISDYFSISLCPPVISSLPGQLPAGKSCKIIVGVFVTANILSPTASTATLYLTVGGVKESVPLTLQAINPVASLSSNVLSFGAQKTGTSSTQKVTLTNVGSGSVPLQLTGLTISQPVSGNFTLTSGAGTNCTSSTTLSPGAACSIYVTFTPTSKGLKIGTVIITDETLIGTQFILLGGVGD